ncbi:hypothetical protein ABPG75_006606 [Micractinium tetrahymenae]
MPSGLLNRKFHPDFEAADHRPPGRHGQVTRLSSARRLPALAVPRASLLDRQNKPVSAPPALSCCKQAALQESCWPGEASCTLQALCRPLSHHGNQQQQAAAPADPHSPSIQRSGCAAGMNVTQWLSATLGLFADEPNCAEFARGGQPCGGQQAAAEGFPPRRSGAKDGAPASARQPSCESDARSDLQMALDAALEAEARDTMLAQCQAMLSLADPDDLPPDPLFDMLPPPGQAAARRRQVCEPWALSAALAAAAAETAALAYAPRGAGVVADSSLAATFLALAPGTCCRKRSADATAPATQLCAPRQRRLQQQQLCVASPAGGACGAAAGAAAAATPRTALARAGGLAAAKRQRLLLTAGKAGRLGGTPGSGVGSNGKVAAAERRAARRVARDLCFTPAPLPAEASQTGTPSTAASVSQLTASKPLLSGHIAGANQHLIVRPFNLLRSPGTSACIDTLNAHIKASAAPRIPFELHTARQCPAAGTPPAAGAACVAPQLRAFRALRLC